jgi:hypothetical protein
VKKLSEKRRGDICAYSTVYCDTVFTFRFLKDTAKDPKILSLLPQHKVGLRKERRAAFEIFCVEIK